MVGFGSGLEVLGGGGGGLAAAEAAKAFAFCSFLDVLSCELFLFSWTSISCAHYLKLEGNTKVFLRPFMMNSARNFVGNCCHKSTESVGTLLWSSSS